MYRIMILKSERSNYQSLYQYLTTTVDNETVPLEIETKDELDAYVEDMLNNGCYAKSDFIVMNYINYSIDAYDYSDDETESGEATDEGETTEDDSGSDEGDSDSGSDTDTGTDTDEETTE